MYYMLKILLHINTDQTKIPELRISLTMTVWLESRQKKVLFEVMVDSLLSSKCPMYKTAMALVILYQDISRIVLCKMLPTVYNCNLQLFHILFRPFINSGIHTMEMTCKFSHDTCILQGSIFSAIGSSMKTKKITRTTKMIQKLVCWMGLV